MTAKELMIMADKTLESVRELRISQEILSREIRESQDRTDEQLEKAFKEIRESQDRTDEQLEKTSKEVDKTIKEMRESQDRLTQEVDKTSKEVDKTIKEMRESQDRADERIEKIAKLVGNIGNNQGEIAEEFFYNSLADKQSLAGIKYDSIGMNWKNKVGNLVDEFDIVMINGQDIALIEVKYKAHQSDLEKLITKKIDNFKTLYPIYANYKIHPALASFKIHKDLKDMALEKGVIVIQRKGDTIETFSSYQTV